MPIEIRKEGNKQPIHTEEMSIFEEIIKKVGDVLESENEEKEKTKETPSDKTSKK